MEGRNRLASALASKYNFAAAKAARMIGDLQTIELAPELEKTLHKRFQQPASTDKGCVAKLAIARALVQLDFDCPGLHLEGLKYVQIEPSWGESIDTAAELRAACALGLANSSHPEKLRELLPLMMDKEWQARAGAARAIGVIGSHAAALLLRFKAMTGDKDAEVIAECFSALLNAEGAAAISFIDRFCDSPRDEIAEAAMLALGAGRRREAIEALRRRFETNANPRAKKALIFAIASSRTDEAAQWLASITQSNDGQIAALGQSAIETFNLKSVLSGAG